MPNNRQILGLLRICQRQWIVGPGGFVGLEMGTVLEMAGRTGITIDALFLHKLSVFEKVALRAMRDKEDHGEQ